MNDNEQYTIANHLSLIPKSKATQGIRALIKRVAFVDGIALLPNLRSVDAPNNERQQTRLIATL